MLLIKKRGQLTISVIIAIVLIAGVILLFFFRSRLTGIFGGEFSPQGYLAQCIEPEIKRGVQILAAQGSYQEPEGFILYQGNKIQYLCYTKDYYKTCVVQQPMIKQNFERELNSLIKNRADQCARDLISEYEKRGYSVSSGEIKPEVSIIPNKILVRFNIPLSVTKETTQKFQGFDVEIDSQMYDLLFIASSIVDYETKLGDSATELYMQYYPNLKIEKVKLSEGTKIYKLTDVVSSEEFSFASRSLAWPAGYGLEGV